MDDPKERAFNSQFTEYFVNVVGEKFNDVSHRLDRIDSKLDKLGNFQWMLVGGAVAVSSIVSLVVAIYFGR